MAALTLIDRHLSPRLSSAAFNAAFRELATARVAYEDAPRNPGDVVQLARASTRLADARRHMQATLHGRRAA